jgi:protein tyrosine phosphatase
MKNTPITFANGSSLTMCDLEDFRDTLKPTHTVVTLCRFPPRFIDSDKQERHHYYFRAHNNDPFIWQHASELVLDLIAEGKHVLLHCVHGRDRTGGVGFIVLSHLLPYKNHGNTLETMGAMRPKIGLDIFTDKISRKILLYESVIRELERGRDDNE